jgi:hypothetical protein
MGGMGVGPGVWVASEIRGLGLSELVVTCAWLEQPAIAREMVKINTKNCLVGDFI